MVKKEITKIFLEELSQHGIISTACQSSGLSRATYYRWYTYDATFRKRANAALKLGKAMGNDFASASLLELIRERNLAAIKWYQSHNDPRYKPKRQKTFIVHSNPIKEQQDYIREAERKKIEEATEGLRILTEQISAEPDSLEVPSN